MKCVKCGAEIGNTFGMCNACRKRHPVPGDFASERQKLFEQTYAERQPSTFIQFWSWLGSDTQRMLNLFGLMVLAVFIYFFFTGSGCSSISSSSFKRPPGILVPEEPVQNAATGKPWEHEGWTINALAGFTIRARVLVSARFTIGVESEISPFDFTLGWGPMSDTAILKQLAFTHGYRFVFWSAADGESWPIPPDEAGLHTSNMHAIPATPEVYQKLKEVRVDDIVTFDGLLVAANKDGGSWVSSLSRSDSGAHACEVMWIDKVEIER